MLVVELLRTSGYQFLMAVRASTRSALRVCGAVRYPPGIGDHSYT